MRERLGAKADPVSFLNGDTIAVINESAAMAIPAREVGGFALEKGSSPLASEVRRAVWFLETATAFQRCISVPPRP